ncbi:uncharacterized protein LODBEIA_P51950 [Lodderomyces beijingensis]|uniref:Uncharacterized protein n=1 Tax=Lodderomyces beijingensis TaxID=1775926 RepID=A0ABP0ZV12_9ASCO
MFNWKVESEIYRHFYHKMSGDNKPSKRPLFFTRSSVANSNTKANTAPNTPQPSYKAAISLPPHQFTSPIRPSHPQPPHPYPRAQNDVAQAQQVQGDSSPNYHYSYPHLLREVDAPQRVIPISRPVWAAQHQQNNTSTAAATDAAISGRQLLQAQNLLDQTPRRLPDANAGVGDVMGDGMAVGVGVGVAEGEGDGDDEDDDEEGDELTPWLVHSTPQSLHPPAAAAAHNNARPPQQQDLDVYNILNPRKASNMGYKEKIVSWLSTVPHVKDEENNEYYVDCYPGIVSDTSNSNISASSNEICRTSNNKEIDLADVEDLLELQAQKVTRYVMRLYANELDSKDSPSDDEASFRKVGGGGAGGAGLRGGGKVKAKEGKAGVYPVAESTRIG